MSGPFQRLVFSDNLTCQKWLFKENHNEMGMLMEGFCWDPVPFSGSRSLVKIDKKSLLIKC